MVGKFGDTRKNVSGEMSSLGPEYKPTAEESKFRYCEEFSENAFWLSTGIAFGS
jgi:hypothetical protein